MPLRNPEAGEILAAVRFINCAGCTTQIVARTHNKKYCRKCRDTGGTPRKAPTYFNCEACGNPTRRVSHLQKRCRDCSAKRLKPKPTKPVQMFICVCGKRARRKAPRQKYCAPCGLEKRKQWSRDNKLKMQEKRDNGKE